MKTTYGMAKGKGLASHEPATKGQCGRKNNYGQRKSISILLKLFDAVRNTFGFNEHLRTICITDWTPAEAARLAKKY